MAVTLHDTLLAFLLTFTSPAYATEAKDCRADLISALSKEMGGLIWSILYLDETRATEFGLFERLDGAAQSATELNDSDPAQSIFNEMQDALDESSPDLGKALKLLSRESVRRCLRQTLGMDLPSEINLPVVFRAHPHTKSFFIKDAPVFQSPKEKRAVALLQKLSPWDYRPPPEFVEPKSFRQARSSALNKELVRRQWQESVDEVQRPLFDWRPIEAVPFGRSLTIYERIRRGDYGSAAEVARRLNIQIPMGRKAKLWKCPSSLLDLAK